MSRVRFRAGADCISHICRVAAAADSKSARLLRSLPQLLLTMLEAARPRNNVEKKIVQEKKWIVCPIKIFGNVSKWMKEFQFTNSSNLKNNFETKISVGQNRKVGRNMIHGIFRKFNYE